MMESYVDLVLNVLYDGENVASSPYLLKGPVYHEKCYCPEPSLDVWLKTMNCPTSYSQIGKQLNVS